MRVSCSSWLILITSYAGTNRKCRRSNNDSCVTIIIMYGDHDAHQLCPQRIRQKVSWDKNKQQGNVGVAKYTLTKDLGLDYTMLCPGGVRGSHGPASGWHLASAHQNSLMVSNNISLVHYPQDSSSACTHTHLGFGVHQSKLDAYWNIFCCIIWSQEIEQNKKKIEDRQVLLQRKVTWDTD